MAKKIFYLPKRDTFMVGANYSTYEGVKCLNGKWKISQGMGSYLWSDQSFSVQYAPDFLFNENEEGYNFTYLFVNKMIDKFSHSTSEILLLVVPNGDFMDELYSGIIDFLDEQSSQITLHFLTKPPLKSFFTTNLVLPFPVDDLLRTGLQM